MLRIIFRETQFHRSFALGSHFISTLRVICSRHSCWTSLPKKTAGVVNIWSKQGTRNILSIFRKISCVQYGINNLKIRDNMTLKIAISLYLRLFCYFDLKVGILTFFNALNRKIIEPRITKIVSSSGLGYWKRVLALAFAKIAFTLPIPHFLKGRFEKVLIWEIDEFRCVERLGNNVQSFSLLVAHGDFQDQWCLQEFFTISPVFNASNYVGKTLSNPAKFFILDFICRLVW